MVPAAISILGLVLSYLIGTQTLKHTAVEVTWAVLSSQLGAFTALPWTLYAQRSKRLRFLARGTLRSWLMLAGVYFAILLGSGPRWLRDWQTLGYLIVPLLMSIGLPLLVYGPLHDRAVRRSSRRV
jgi:hypothetical protein